MKLKKKPELKPWTARIKAENLIELEKLKKKSGYPINDLINKAIEFFLKDLKNNGGPI